MQKLTQMPLSSPSKKTQRTEGYVDVPVGSGVKEAPIILYSAPQ